MRIPLIIAGAVAATFQLAGAAKVHAAGTADVPGDDLASAVFAADSLGATVIKGAACGIATPGVPPGAVFTNNTHIVITPSGNAALICHAEVPVGPPRAVIVNDLFCGIAGTPGTGQSHTVITPSGNVLLTCHLNGSSM